MHQDLNVVPLVGSPNCGKTTLFNWLTGSRFKTVNYPGATVDYSIGRTHERFGAQVPVMDTPGTYSLQAKSPEEQVTAKVIYEELQGGKPRLVVSVMDATQLSRHLLVTQQLLHSGFRVVAAVTMADLLKESGKEFDPAKLAELLGCPVVVIDGRLGGGVQELVEVVRKEAARARASEPAPLLNWGAQETERTLHEAARIEAVVVRDLPGRAGSARLAAAERTARVDRVLLHPVFGLLIFLMVMAALFTSIFWVATPLMDAVDGALSWVGEQVAAAGPGTLWADFIANGLIASFAAVLVFVPQIFILFLGIVAFEDSGYLARSATLVDKPFSKLGLNGRSFVPLLSAYACAVPAMIAARTINSRRERFLTLFVIPLMSCSARLPVYALLLSFLYRGQESWKAGVTLSGLYFGSLVVGALASIVASRFLKISDQSLFMLELPIYRRPHLRHVLRAASTRTYSYVRRAGLPIFTFALLIWGATTFPRHDLEDKTERLNQSYAAQLGQYIEPIFQPMGGDWRTGVGLISAFAAREVFVSSMAVVFSVTDEDEDSMQEGLLAKMAEAKTASGQPLFTLSSVLGLILFFMIALQCLSTVAVAVRESGGWRFALFQLAIFNLVAYVLTVSIVQGLRAFGVP